jgi:hypothetical protein
MNPNPITWKNDISFFKTKYPARGKIASLGIGGKTVSIKAARKTPGYRLSETNEITHSIKDSISVN